MNERYKGEERRSNQWHLDKKIPIAIFVMIALQLIALVWFSADVRFNQQKNTTDIRSLQSRIDRNELQMNGISVQLARIEENARMQVSLLERLERKVEKSN